MQSLIINRPGSMTLERLADPTPGQDDVLIAVHGCTICGSDIRILDGDMSGVGYPLVPGHEWSGTVVDAGRNCRELIGARVVSETLQICGQCIPCTEGRPNFCEHLIEPGLTAQGAFAEFIAVPARTVRHLPEALDLTLACLVEPVSVALHAIDRQPAHSGDRVLLLGGGGIGLLCLAALVQEGTGPVVLIDPNEFRREMGLALGASAAYSNWLEEEDAVRAALGGAADVVYCTANRADALADAVSACAPSGRICQVGYPGSEKVKLFPADLMAKEINLVGALSPTADWGRAISFVITAGEALRPLITHHLPLVDHAQAFDLMRGRKDGAIRVMLG